jgi:hypothetical protein
MHILEVRGEAPPIVGEICEELIAQQYVNRGRLEDPANLLHLRFGGRWFRMFIDWGELVWQPGTGAPQADEADELGASHPLFDLAGRYGLRGLRVAAIRSRALAGGSLTTLEFEWGARLSFRNVDGRTVWLVPR